jgi:hypothetical protein
LLIIREETACSFFESNVQRTIMNRLKCLALVAVAGIFMTVTAFTVTAPKLDAQVAVEVGVAPVCPYGYYDVPPYACAPYGYYGPEWFTGGVFIGAGPWFHGSANFRGHVDNRFHPDHGYRGPMPKVGEHAEPARRLDKIEHFKGSEMRDGRGHVAKR